jgi:hypothetical protein
MAILNFGYIDISDIFRLDVFVELFLSGLDMAKVT